MLQKKVAGSPRSWIGCFAALIIFSFSHIASAQAPRSAIITVTPTASGAAAITSVESPGPAHHASRVLVKFRNAARDFLPGSGTARPFPGNADLFVVPNPPGLSVPDAISRYKSNPNV